LKRFNCNDEDAEELTVEVLRRIHGSVERFDPSKGAKLTTWIWRIAHNLGVDHVRKQNQLSTKSIPAISFEDAAAKTFESEQAAEWFRHCGNEPPSANLGESDDTAPDNVRRLRRALAGLTENDRNVINMRLCMEYDEIAQVENISETGIRSRYARAIERLRTAYELEDGQ
jgi:RNA polymerase sigma factor (sigma-70 family)